MNKDVDVKVEFKLDDSVWHRVIQIVQEAILTGVDCSDIMRLVRVEHSDNDPCTLVLSKSYRDQVTKEYEKMVTHAEELKKKQKPKITIKIPEEN